MTNKSPLERPSCPHVDPIVFTEREVAQLLRLPRDQVRLARVNGLLPYRQLGPTARGIRYTREDLDAFLATQARTGMGQGSHRDEIPRVLPAPRRRDRVA